MFISCPSKNIKDWSEYTLILPAVSIGNVGQLTIELILSNTDNERVGYFYDDCLLALVGSNSILSPLENKSGGDIVTGVEVYEIPAKKLVIVQQRVPIKTKKKTEFCKKLIEWIQSNNFKLVVLLSSSAAYERIDSQLTGSPFRFLSSPEFEKQYSLKDSHGWHHLEWRNALPSPSVLEITSKEEPKHLYIPGGGITKQLYKECCKKAIPFVSVLKFCSEGDNIPDALNLATHCNKWLKILDISSNLPDEEKWKSWTIPSSWKFMFGHNPPASIY